MAQANYQPHLNHIREERMSSITTQFHSLPEELADFILVGTKNETIYFVLVGGLPFSAHAVASDDLRKTLIAASQAHSPLSLCLLHSPPNFSADSRLRFYDLNPNNIVVDVGLYNNKGLKQSRISTISNDPIILKLAKAVAKELRKNTHAGVTAVNVEMSVRETLI